MEVWTEKMMDGWMDGDLIQISMYKLKESQFLGFTQLYKTFAYLSRGKDTEDHIKSF